MLHQRAVFTGDKNSLLVQHCLQNNHEFDFDDVNIIDQYTYFYSSKLGTRS